MNVLPENVQKLIQKLERIPGIGQKSAARIAIFFLKSPKSYTKELGDLISNLGDSIVSCKICFNISSNDICEICSNSQRDPSIICVVEDPLDVLAFENGSGFQGLYHILGGVISPVNGISPSDLTISKLLDRLKNNTVKELILATNPNIEGEATAMYIKREVSNLKCCKKLKITRLARGLPSGADIEYADRITLKKAFEGRTEL